MQLYVNLAVDIDDNISKRWKRGAVLHTVLNPSQSQKVEWEWVAYKPCYPQNKWLTHGYFSPNIRHFVISNYEYILIEQVYI